MTESAIPPHTAATEAKTPGFASTTSTVFGRGISYIDAVYGFAATLLIANVDAPPPEAWLSMDALVNSGAATQAIGFVLSFTVIAVFWRQNVRVVDRLSGLDGVTTVINLAAAGSVIFIAFTTQGISDPHTSDLALPTVMYAANLALVSVLLTLLYEVARMRGLIRHPVGPRRRTAALVAELIVPAVFLASIPIALVWGAAAGKLTWAALLVLSPAAGIVARRVTDDPPEAARHDARPGLVP